MTSYKPEKAWACVCPYGSPRPFIHVGTLEPTRADAMENVGAAWARTGETPREGWKRAYKAGWRTSRVVVSVVEKD
jgi:hypothetical protein